LTLSGNQIKALAPTTFAGLGSVQHLDIHNNQITSLHEKIYVFGDFVSKSESRQKNPGLKNCRRA